MKRGLTVCGLLMAFLPLHGPALSEERHSDARLWQNTPNQTDSAPLPPKKPWVIRDREIAFDPALVAMLKDASARPHSSITISLFDEKSYELDIVSTVSRLSDVASVKGTLKNVPRSTWSLVVSGALVNGTVQIGDRLYKVEHVQNGRHRLMEVDPTKLPPE
jgi:hypothetical protein